jgi:PhnB protein
MAVSEPRTGSVRWSEGCSSASFYSNVMAKSIPEGWHSVTPRLVVHDPAKLVDFLKTAFDARGDFTPDTPSVIRIGDSIVMVSGVGPRDPMPAFLYLYVDDVDATYQRALEAGAVRLEEPADMPYGDRRGMVRDPCGNDWQIATHTRT